jgi:aspartate/methionine/tyrosine aminotransferase
MAALGSVQVGYFTPDYTAYQEALGLFARITPSPLLHRKMNEALMSSEEFRFQASGRGLGAMLLSNPANPTGQSLEGEELKNYVTIARELGLALLMDEFYSHYYVSTWTLKMLLIFRRDDERRWLTTSFLIYLGPNLT